MGVIGGVRRRIGQFSIWRVPNLVLEPRGLFLGERVDALDRLAKIRSGAGLAILVGAAVYYSGLSHLASATTDRHGTKVITVTANTPEASWFIGVVVSAVVAVLTLPLVSLYLVWRTKPGAKRATVRQLRWPLIAIAAWFGFFAAASPFVALDTYATKATRHTGFDVRAAVYLITFFVAVVLLVWITKALYLAAAGMFRAEDGHPLLGIIAAPIVAASAAAIMSATGGGNGLVGVPNLIGYALAWGGTVTILVLSWLSSRILKKRFPADYPFRNGPILAGLRPAGEDHREPDPLRP